MRFFLKRVAPFFELYTSPVNLDPLSPAMPGVHPARIRGGTGGRRPAASIRRACRRTPRASAPACSRDVDFLHPGEGSPETRTARNSATYWTASRDGFLFYYFGNVDQVAHMMWRARDPQHPAYDAATDKRNAAVVEELYQGLDAVVADTMARLGPDDLLVVMSDHGFTSWRRAFRLNSWLRDNGYIALKGPPASGPPGLVRQRRLVAHARVHHGVERPVREPERPGEGRRRGTFETARPWCEELVGQAARRHRFSHGHAGDHENVSPRGGPTRWPAWRTSRRTWWWATPKARADRMNQRLAACRPNILVDNTSHWSGDHCMDHEAVPGVLLSSRRLKRPARTLQQLPGALLNEFGIDSFPQRRPGP